MDHNSQDKPPLDDAFDTKVSIWKSFSSAKCGGEERTGDLDDGLLDHPVMDSTRYSLFRDGKCALEGVEKPAVRINPFWTPSGIPDKETVEQHERDGESLGNRDEVGSTLNEAGGTGDCSIAKRLKSSADCSSAFFVECKQASNGLPRICSGTVGNREAHASRDMEVTPIEESLEIVSQLENRIRALSAQLESCRQALRSKDAVIEELEGSLEMLKSEQANRIDYEFIGQCVSRGLEIVRELRAVDSPRDFTKENYNLRVENMSLKNIIEELAGRVRILKDSLRDASRS